MRSSTWASRAWSSRLAAALCFLAFFGCKKGDDAAGGAPSASAGPTTEFTPRAGPYLVGELGRARDFTMSLDTVRECPDPSPSPPKRGFVRLGLELTLEGTSAREVPANAFYATLRDASGEAYAGTLFGCEPPLPPIRLTNRVKARGHVNFDVPKMALNFELRYAVPVIGNGAEETEELRFTVRR